MPQKSQDSNSLKAYLWTSIDLFDIANSRFERDLDQARFPGRRLDWFSRSGVRLLMNQEPAGNVTTCSCSRILTNFVVNFCQNTYKIAVNLRPSCFDASVNDFFDFKSIYCLILLSNFTKNKEVPG